MGIVGSAIKSLKIGGKISYGHLSVYPLLKRERAISSRRYQTLDDATQIEISASTFMSNTIKIWNRGDSPLLIIEGQVLQRDDKVYVASETALLPPESAHSLLARDSSG